MHVVVTPSRGRGSKHPDPETRKARRGVAALRGHLEYVERRGRAEGVVSGRPPDSPPEVEVARRLEAAGFTVDCQVGSSTYWIDLAVRHPRRPTAYLAGIEFDGASYHSDPSARTSDRIRQGVLEGLGWTIFRIWSTDWFADPEGEADRLAARLVDLMPREHGA